MRAELTVEIARTPEEVWAYLTDVSKVPSWQSGVHEAQIVGGGEIAAGARIEESRSLFGRDFHTTLEICDCEPPRVFGLRALGGPVAFTVRHDLEPSSAGTRLRVVAEADTGFLPGMAAGLLARRAEKQFRKDFDRLKAVLES